MPGSPCAARRARRADYQLSPVADRVARTFFNTLDSRCALVCLSTKFRGQSFVVSCVSRGAGEGLVRYSSRRKGTSIKAGPWIRSPTEATELSCYDDQVRVRRVAYGRDDQELIQQVGKNVGVGAARRRFRSGPAADAGICSGPCAFADAPTGWLTDDRRFRA